VAVIEQVPAISAFAVLPETEQTVGVVVVKLTGKLELAEAESAAVAPTI
jgi:hypothetical protein